MNRDHYIWPIGLTVFLVTVVAVNFAFIYIATQNAPLVEDSYDLVER